MKYERMTRHSDLGTLHACDMNGKEQPLCELTAIDTDILIGCLCILEDKIESGEIISTVQDEQSEQEIEFFAEHNAAVRKQAVKEFAERVKMAFYYEFDELIPSIMADKIDELVEECAK